MMNIWMNNISQVRKGEKENKRKLWICEKKLCILGRKKGNHEYVENLCIKSWKKYKKGKKKRIMNI